MSIESVGSAGPLRPQASESRGCEPPLATPASEAGARIGAITNADTGIFQITAPNSTETSDSGSYDTRTIDKDITAVIGVSFRVE